MSETKVEGKSEVDVIMAIPLKKISYNATITGMFAQVECTQEFQNQNKISLEAVYVFPMPEEASVVGCEMVIGDKKVTAELKEQKQAKQEYDDAIAAGHHASLLEQRRPNLFCMSVGGIEPGEQIKVVTVYNQRVPWQDNGGRFNLPLVVAPRFIPGLPTEGKQGGGWAADTREVPDASLITPVVAKEGVTYTADIEAVVAPGFACKVTSPSHELIVGEHRYNKRPVKISATDLTPDRDFIICYQNDAVKIATAVHQGVFQGEGFATIALVPPAQAVVKDKDVILLLDVSRSMSGAKIAGLKIVAEKVARKLAEQSGKNRVAVIAFEKDIHPVQGLAEISEDTYTAINKLESMGNTYAGKALDYCFGLLAGETGRERYILLVSDGQTEDRWSKIVPGVRVIAAGIDVATNMAYLRDIARETGGTSLAIYPGEDYDRAANNLVGLLSGPVIREIKVISGVVDVLGTGDVYQGMPGILFLKDSALPEEIWITGSDSQGQALTLNVELKTAEECSFCHQLWAREKLREPKLADQQIVEISLKYGVLSAKTAFVAVHLKQVPGQKPQRIEIPVSLPTGWDYDKIFGPDVACVGAVMLGDPRRTRGSGLYKGLGLIEAADTVDDITLEPILGVHETVEVKIPKVPKKPAPSITHSVDKLEVFVEKLEQGTVDRSGIEKEWSGLLLELATAQVGNWTAFQRAKAYYLLLKIKTYALKVSMGILRSLSVAPNKADIEAYEWWVKGQRLLGRAI